MDSSPEKYSASPSQTPPAGAPPRPNATSQSLQHAAQGQPVHYLDSSPDTLPFEAPPPPPSGDGVPALGQRAAAARWPGLTCPACGWRPVEPGAACPHCFTLVPVATTRAMPWRLISAGALALVVILSAILVVTMLHPRASQPVAKTNALSLPATTVPTATTPLPPTIAPTQAASTTSSGTQPTSQPALPPVTQATPTPTRAPAPTNTPPPQPIALPGPPAGASTLWPTLQTNQVAGCSGGWQTGNRGLSFTYTTGKTYCNYAQWNFAGNQTCSIWIPIGQDVIGGQIWSPNTSISYGENWENWSKIGAIGVNQRANVGNILYLGAWANLQRVQISTDSGETGTLIEAGPLYYSCN